nr:MAG TPA_asm: hypothetical protein [Caudoviricetes sp.]
MINYFRSKCKLCLGTIYCVFQLKIAHFRRFEHNILWFQKKNSDFLQKTIQNNRYFLACFCAICT